MNSCATRKLGPHRVRGTLRTAARTRVTGQRDVEQDQITGEARRAVAPLSSFIFYSTEPNNSEGKRCSRRTRCRPDFPNIRRLFAFLFAWDARLAPTREIAAMTFRVAKSSGRSSPRGATVPSVFVDPMIHRCRYSNSRSRKVQGNSRTLARLSTPSRIVIFSAIHPIIW